MRRLIAKALWWLLEPELQQHDEKMVRLQAKMIGKAVGPDAGAMLERVIDRWAKAER